MSLSLCMLYDAKIRSHIVVHCCWYGNRDAAWELDNNAFTDQLERYSFCDVAQCRCPNGRSANLLDTLVIIIIINSVIFVFVSAAARSPIY